ncbi:MAG: prolyl-tRNA synthetase associated domain-containing protein [Gammaproteobacteria bacterium]|nr:prolyl-tRNA synthetase associated domain-containing protein [Gammaproteobacteria bacterium]
MSDAVDTRRLADRSRPQTAAQLFALLDRLGIAHTTVEHPPLFTVEEAKALRGELPGAHTKNLFLRNKKGRMWLVTCLEDRRVDLRALAERLGAGRVSFGSPPRLMQALGVTPGAVTPFALVNDRAGAVEAVLDRDLLRLAPLNFHPLENARTTAISPEGLLAFLQATGHRPTLVDFAALGG